MPKYTLQVSLDRSEHQRIEALVKNVETLFETKAHAARECIKKGLEHYEAMLQ